MREFKNGTLRSSDGKKVTSRKQALAIAISESEDYAEKADLISAIHIGSVREAEEILKAAGTEGDLFEKARKVGDIHPNGKWVWTEYKPGKFDWRGIKGGAKGGGGGASKPSPAPSVDLKGITAEDKAGLSSLALTLNNYYGYVDIHLSGKNEQRFSSATITNFRNAIKEIYQGSKTSNTGVESESAKKLVKNIYDELKTVKSTDLQGAKDKIEKIAPMLKQALKQAKEPTSKKASDQKSDVTIKKLDDASDGSVIKITTAQTGSNIVTFTKKEGKWYSKNTMTRGEVEASSKQVLNSIEKYNKKSYKQTVNLKTGKTSEVNEETIKKQLKEFRGKLLGLQTKDGIIGIHVQFEPDDYYAPDHFVKKHKEWRATTNTGNNYEFVYLNKEGKEALRKRGFQGIDDEPKPTKKETKSTSKKSEKPYIYNDGGMVGGKTQIKDEAGLLKVLNGAKNNTVLIYDKDWRELDSEAKKIGEKNGWKVELGVDKDGNPSSTGSYIIFKKKTK